MRGIVIACWALVAGNAHSQDWLCHKGRDSELQLRVRRLGKLGRNMLRPYKTHCMEREP